MTAVLSGVDPGFGDDDPGDDSPALEEDPSWLETRGFLYFSTQFIDISIEVTADTGQQVSQTVDVLESENDTFPSLLYRLIPVVVLIGAGLYLATLSFGQRARARDGARAGALVVCGYLPAVVAGTLIFSHQTSFQGGVVSYGIPPGSAVLIAGVLYPVVFGAIGGYIPYRRNR